MAADVRACLLSSAKLSAASGDWTARKPDRLPRRAAIPARMRRKAFAPILFSCEARTESSRAAPLRTVVSKVDPPGTSVSKRSAQPGEQAGVTDGQIVFPHELMERRPAKLGTFGLWPTGSFAKRAAACGLAISGPGADGPHSRRTHRKTTAPLIASSRLGAVSNCQHHLDRTSRSSMAW